MGLIYWMRQTHMMFPDTQLARIRLAAYPLVEKPASVEDYVRQFTQRLRASPELKR
jgi:hypothetical protein